MAYKHGSLINEKLPDISTMSPLNNFLYQHKRKVT